MVPYFSIILPVYNVAPWLHRCVRSVLEQNAHDIEIILVDDGSTDASGRMCEELAALHDCVRVLHKENGGLSSARNEGLRIAQGEYIWWVDSDDWIEPGALDLLRQTVTTDAPDVIKFGHFRVAEEKIPVGSIAKPGVYTDVALEVLRDQGFFEAGKFCLSAWSHVYRRGFLQENALSFVSERCIGSEDYLFNLQALLKARTVTVLTDLLYSYELRQGSLSQSYKKDLSCRYGCLYEHLRNSCGEAFRGKVDRFYVWHLIRGTCIPHEYYAGQDRPVEQRRENVRRLLALETVQKAIAGCDCTGLTIKQKIQLLAMKAKLEILFYWLYVVKPTGRRRNKP